MSYAVVTTIIRTHNADIVVVDVSMLLLFADLQAVAVKLCEVVAIAVSCFLFPPCYVCCSLSLNLVQ